MQCEAEATLKLDRDRTQKYAKAFDAGYKWYLDRQRADGSFGTETDDTVSFYNTLAVLSLRSKWCEANRFAVWARDRGVIEVNRLLGVDHAKFSVRASYYPAWNIWGAHCCHMFDLSLGAIDVLLTYQNETTGGFYLSRDGRDKQSGYMDVGMTTGIAGMACLITGRLDRAIKAGEFLINGIDNQPGLPGRYYNYYEPGREQLVTSMEDVRGNPFESEIEEMLFQYDTQSGDEQAYACLAPPMILLCYLHQATGEGRYLEAARAIFELCHHAGDQCYVRGCSTKLGWGLALLYRLTGDGRVFDATVRLCDQLCLTQAQEGAWVHTISGYTNYAEQPAGLSMAVAGDALFALNGALSYLR